MAKNLWLSPQGKKWIVQEEKGKTLSEHYKKEPARQNLVRLAKQREVEAIEQNRWGKIVSKDSYGNESKTIDTEH